MEIFGIGICALCAVLFAALVQKSNKEYALLISFAAVVVLLFVILQRAEPLVNELETLAGSLGSSAVQLVLQAVGITVIGQTVSRVCKDTGESALAYTVDLAARVAVLLAALPMVGDILNFLSEVADL